MGASCSARDETADGSAAFSSALRLTATQQTCLDSWRSILDGKTGYIEAQPKGTAPATLFFDAFYGELTRRSPATADFFAYGGIPRKARSLMRMVASLLQLGGKKAGTKEGDKEQKELQAIAESHAFAHGSERHHNGGNEHIVWLCVCRSVLMCLCAVLLGASA